ncbi:MAG: hypothetical protein KDL31_12135, partial [Kiritimatiellae bacterium]|nr:hypothetical protein [Kiritimatiellia bacterium]
MKPHGHLRSVFCVILLVLRPWTPAAGADPIDEGRASLVAYKQKPHPAAALIAADQAFARAQKQNPGSVEANVYRALTRLLVLMHEDPIRARLSEFGWSEEGRNYWAWAATLPPTLPKPGIESETVTDILDNTVLPEVDLVLADLDSVPKDWSGSFLISSNEIPSKGDREVDVGDVAVLSFFLHGLKASLLLQSAYDTQATIDRAFAVNEKGTLTTLPISLNGDVLERFPRFGSVIEEKRIQEAEQAAEAAVAAFHRARSLIEQETDNQKDDLFSIDMVKWAAPFVESMNAPQTITFAEGMTGLLDGRRLFRAPYVQKAQLPEFNDRNDVVLGTFPDPTFNGVFPDMTQAKLSLLLRWMHRKSPTQKDLFGVAYGNNLYVAVGESGTILTSSDSREWVLAEGPVSKTLKSVCFGNGFFVAVGEEGQVAVSGDGKTWMVRDSGTAAKLEAVAYARGRFIAVGEEGQILTSASGQAWDRSESGVSETLRGVAGNERGWVAVGNRGLVLQSVDGQSWKRRDTGVSDALLGVSANRDGYTVTGYKGLLMTSSMGEEWTVRASGVDRSLHAACEQDGLI